MIAIINLYTGLHGVVNSINALLLCCNRAQIEAFAASKSLVLRFAASVALGYTFAYTLDRAVRPNCMWSQFQHSAAVRWNKSTVERKLIYTQVFMAPQVSNAEATDTSITHVQKIERNLHCSISSVEQ